MWLIVIVAFIFIVSLTAFIVLGKKEAKYKSSHFYGRDEPAWFIISTVALFFSFLTLFIMCGVAIDVRVTRDTTYEKMLFEREVIIAQLERIDDNANTYIISGDVGSLESVYAQLIRFNNDLIVNNKWYSNNFFGMFYNQRIHEIPLINLDDYT